METLRMAPLTTSKTSMQGIAVDTCPLRRCATLKSARLSPTTATATTTTTTTTRNVRRESERVKTFKWWTLSFMKAEDMAKNGFYYTGELDIVRCAFCGVEIGYWEKGDDPAADHAKWSPNCDFVCGRDCGNVAAGDAGDDEDSAPEADFPPSYDTCGPFRTEIRPYSAPERVPLERNLWRDLEHLGVSKTSGPVIPRYATYESRLKTFEKWPASHGPRPEALAEAGFFYALFHDNTVCFHCGGGLKSWEPDDDPWVEHARWFGMCGFVNIQKGKEFVKRVAAEKDAVLPGKVALQMHKEQTTSSSAAAAAAPAASTSAVATAEVLDETKAPETSPPVTASLSSRSSSSSPKEIELCRICYVREREIVFLPCGHFVSCTKCAPSLTNCAVCRKPFEATVRAYLS